jgi:hypothetical protein
MISINDSGRWRSKGFWPTQPYIRIVLNFSWFFYPENAIKRPFYPNSIDGSKDTSLNIGICYMYGRIPEKNPALPFPFIKYFQK